jgi:hypothetical protein
MRLNCPLDIHRQMWNNIYMKKNDVDFDKPLPKYILESCIYCGRFTRTKDKTSLILFMYDHYGEDGIRKCSKTWYGKFVYAVINWKHRNY